MHDDSLIDGVAADADWLNERALQFGDGLFETVAVVRGEPCLWDAHMARFAEGCRRLHLPKPDFGLLEEEAGLLGAGRAQAVLKIYWTAGRSARGYRRPTPLQPRRMLHVSDWPYAGQAGAWVLRQCLHRLGENPALAQIKHLNRLDQVIARSEWDDPTIQEGIMLGQDGRVVCGTLSNLFVQKGNTLVTPSLAGAGIAGVVRGLALAIARTNGEQVHEDVISVQQLSDADALYLTNSLIGVVRVAGFGTRRYDLDFAEPPLMTETRRRCHQPGREGIDNG